MGHHTTDVGQTEEGFTSRSFRDALGHFATGVAVVTAPCEGDPIGMTVNSFTSVSLDPPLVLFSAARTLLGLQKLLDAPSFGINVLRDEQIELSNRFAKAASEKWAGLSFDIGPRLGCPLIQSALARFECLPYANYDAGDHILIVARVVAFEIAGPGAPLLFFRGKYRALAPDLPERSD